MSSRDSGECHTAPRLLFVLNRNLGGATAHARGLVYRPLFAENGWHVEFASVAQPPEADDRVVREDREDEIVRIASRFDLVYLLKVNSLRLVERLKAQTSAKVIFDLTDSLWYPIHYRSGWQYLSEILCQSDAVFSENEWICAYGRKYNSRVWSIPACSQVERFDPQRRCRTERKPADVVIGWVGTSGTVQGLHKLLVPLEALWTRYPSLSLRIVGCGDTKQLPPFKRVRYTCISEYNEDDMIREILDFDIGLFPPPLDIEDYCVRGVLKALLYMAGGVPPVCQNAGECRRIISDGENGMLANDERDWTEKLDRLVSSPALRQEMGQRALETARQSHSLRQVFAVLRRALLGVHSRPRQHRWPWKRLKHQMFKYVNRLTSRCASAFGIRG